MGDYKDFSSLPPEEEQQFVPFEEASQKASKSAMNIGRVAGFGLLVVLGAIIMSFPKPEPKNLLGVEEQADSPAVIRGEETAPAPEATPTPSEPTGDAPTP